MSDAEFCRHRDQLLHGGEEILWPLEDTLRKPCTDIRGLDEKSGEELTENVASLGFDLKALV
jgi:hypothetical protein